MMRKTIKTKLKPKLVVTKLNAFEMGLKKGNEG